MPPIPQTALAWILAAGAEPSGLQPGRIDVVQPIAGEVLVRNVAVGLNPIDWKVLGGPACPVGGVPGCDGAGTVIALGAGVPADWLGARVAYHTHVARPGSFAELTPVASRALIRVPHGLAFEIAAALPCPALTAWQAVEKIPRRPGASVLVSGAGGGVGNYLVQLALARGFAVTARCHPRGHARLAAFGARCLGGDTPPPPAAFHAVIDCAGEAEPLATSLKANGHLVCIAGRPARWPTALSAQCWSLHEVALGALHLHGDDADWAELTAAGEQILADVARGALRPETTVLRDFAELPVQLEALKRRAFSGKVVVRVPDPE